MSELASSYFDTLQTSTTKVKRSVGPRAKKLLKTLVGKKNILITTHANPDPDAVASCFGLQKLLQIALPDSATIIRFKGNGTSPRLRGLTRVAHFEPAAWNDDDLSTFDAIVLLDTQPCFSVSPLPTGVVPTAVIDHHRGRGRHSKIPFCDIRTDVGATASIIFNYFMELQIAIDSTLASALLYAVESDLAGAAGQQSQLDTIAISGLLLAADIRKLWQMRYIDIPPSFFAVLGRSIESALRYDTCLIAHAGQVNQVEDAALLADSFLRCEGVDCVLISTILNGRIVISLRSSLMRHSAGEIMRRLVNKIGDGGGHKTKAGGQIPLESDSAANIDRILKTLKRRLLRILHIKSTRGSRLA